MHMLWPANMSRLLGHLTGRVSSIKTGNMLAGMSHHGVNMLGSERSKADCELQNVPITMR
jgi:hypothetical protein